MDIILVFFYRKKTDYAPRGVDTKKSFYSRLILPNDPDREEKTKKRSKKGINNEKKTTEQNELF